MLMDLAPWIRRALACLLLAAPIVAAQDAVPAGGSAERDIALFLERYCQRCHEGAEPKGELDLSGGVDAARIAGGLDAWDLLLERVELAEMPPSKAEQPSEAERARVVASLRAALDAQLDARIAVAGVDPGRPPLRRLNLREYRAAVRDLFGLDFDPRAYFPEDGAGHGFDTVGSGLGFSELFVEGSLSAAEALAERLIAVDDSKPPKERAFRGETLEGVGRRGFKVLASHGEVKAHTWLEREGRYRLRVRTTAQQAGPEPARFRLRAGERQLGDFEVRVKLDEGVQQDEVEAVLPAGDCVLAVRFVNDYYSPEDPDPSQRDRNLWVESIELLGPLDPPPPSAYQERLAERFGAQANAWRERALLSHWIRRLWRRPARAGEVGRLAQLPPDESSGPERERLQLTALLASPHFLVRGESDPLEAVTAPARALTPHELVVRLSLFLWGSVPDEELDRLVDAGGLASEADREALVRRMLRDARALALAEGFVPQWLQLRGLERMQPDPRLVPDWDAGLRRAMLRESELFFAEVVRTNAPISELLEADWSLWNETLAAHYRAEPGETGGVDDPGGIDSLRTESVASIEDETFRRVSFADSPRRGLLGQAAVLTVTSDPARTSPVKRGRWVLDALWNAPPPAAPPDVPPFDTSAEASRERSLKERWAEHRARPECAVCHDVMDPLGFGLENFDAVGRWRTRYEHFDVDATGTLPDGSEFDGPAELAAILLEGGRFERALCERLFVYAIGRGLDVADRRFVDAALARARAAGGSLAELIVAVATSEAFTHVRCEQQR